MIKFVVKGEDLYLSASAISTVKAVPVAKDKFVPILITTDQKVMVLEIVGTPFQTESECITAITQYIEEGGN